MKKILLIPIFIILAIGIIYIGYVRISGKAGSQRIGQPVASPTAVQTSEPVPENGANIQVTFPLADSLISSPVTVKGSARVFENALSVRLQDQNGEEIAIVHIMADAADVGKFGPFTATIPFPTQQLKKGSIEVFSNSAKDGTEINKVIIPVSFVQ